MRRAWTRGRVSSTVSPPPPSPVPASVSLPSPRAYIPIVRLFRPAAHAPLSLSLSLSHTATRLEVVQGIRAHAHMLAVARRQQAPHYPAPDAALALASASASGPASAAGPVALLPPLDVDPRTGPQSH